MEKEIERKLIEETTMDDIPETCRPYAELIGIENLIKLSRYSCGDKLYFPKVEAVVRKARDKHINAEYNGFNAKELAMKYDITIEQIRKILRSNDPLQISLFDVMQ